MDDPCRKCGGTGREWVPSESMYDACIQCDGSGSRVTVYKPVSLTEEWGLRRVTLEPNTGGQDDGGGSRR